MNMSAGLTQFSPKYAEAYLNYGIIELKE